MPVAANQKEARFPSLPSKPGHHSPRSPNVLPPGNNHVFQGDPQSCLQEIRQLTSPGVNGMLSDNPTIIPFNRLSPQGLMTGVSPLLETRPFSCSPRSTASGYDLREIPHRVSCSPRSSSSGYDLREIPHRRAPHHGHLNQQMAQSSMYYSGIRGADENGPKSESPSRKRRRVTHRNGLGTSPARAQQPTSATDNNPNRNLHARLGRGRGRDGQLCPHWQQCPNCSGSHSHNFHECLSNTRPRHANIGQINPTSRDIQSTSQPSPHHSTANVASNHGAYMVDFSQINPNIGHQPMMYSTSGDAVSHLPQAAYFAPHSRGGPISNNQHVISSYAPYNNYFPVPPPAPPQQQYPLYPPIGVPPLPPVLAPPFGAPRSSFIGPAQISPEEEIFAERHPALYQLIQHHLGPTPPTISSSNQHQYRVNPDFFYVPPNHNIRPRMPSGQLRGITQPRNIGIGHNASGLSYLLQVVAMIPSPPVAAYRQELQNHDSPTIESVIENYEALLSLAEILGDAMPRGLSREEIERLPMYRFSSEFSRSDQTSCVICMCDFERRQLIRVLPCSHEFHAKCVDKWLKTNRTCPICRGDTIQDRN